MQAKFLEINMDLKKKKKLWEIADQKEQIPLNPKI
jgi:hypothetical protein